MFEIGWFSSGRDEAARDLLQVVFDSTQNGTVKGRLSFVFVSRERGERPESDEFIHLAEHLGLEVICLSHRGFKPQLRRAGLDESRRLGGDSPLLKKWRKQFDARVVEELAGRHPDIIVLAGYMLVLSPEMCHKYDIINLHPALPGGPKGTWQEVIWQLMEEESQETGVLMHLITPELDEGPPIAYCQFSIADERMTPLWEQWRARRKKAALGDIQKSEGENEPLFKEIRRRGLMREFPIIVATLKAAASGEFSIENAEVMARGHMLAGGLDLTADTERTLD